MLWNTHTGRTPPPSPRTAQYAHKELTDIVRELVQEGSLSRAASRIFSSGLAPASIDTVQLLIIGKCPAANPYTFPDLAAQLPGGGPTSTTTLGSAILHNVTPAQRESLHKSWKDTLASLPSRSAPGGDGWLAVRALRTRARRQPHHVSLHPTGHSRPGYSQHSKEFSINTAPSRLP